MSNTTLVIANTLPIAIPNMLPIAIQNTLPTVIPIRSEESKRALHSHRTIPETGPAIAD